MRMGPAPSMRVGLTRVLLLSANHRSPSVDQSSETNVLVSPNIREIRYLTPKALALLPHANKRIANPRVADIHRLPGGHIELASF
jgi:hypothetical protein